jgi:hypothetical protein
MTSCAECLTILSTARLSELGQSAAIAEHCGTCERCAAVAAEIRFAEQRLALRLAESRPLSLSYQVASDAVTGSDKLRRRQTARLFRGVVGAFGLFLLGTYIKEQWWDRRGPAPITRTIAPKCMKPEEAVSVVSPFLHSDRPAAYTSIGFPAITIRGRESEVLEAIAQLDAFEAKFCNLPDPRRGPAATTIPSVETPRKD